MESVYLEMDVVTISKEHIVYTKKNASLDPKIFKKKCEQPGQTG